MSADKEHKEHLEIDLEFLDKKELTRAVSKSNTVQEPTTQKSPTREYGWKNILIVVGVALFFWAIFSGDSDSNITQTTSPSSGGANVIVGEYSCSSYHSDRVSQLEPTEDESTIDLAQAALSRRSDEIDRMYAEIENSDVNENSSEYEIDEYNAKLDLYRSKVSTYNRDVASLDPRIDQYNAQVERYNNYLSANCTKR